MDRAKIEKEVEMLLSPSQGNQLFSYNDVLTVASHIGSLSRNQALDDAIRVSSKEKYGYEATMNIRALKDKDLK